MERKNMEKKRKKEIWILIAGACVVVTMLIVLLIAALHCKHEWGEWVISTPSTCLTQGTQERTCMKCNKVETDAAELSGHMPFDDDGDCTTAAMCSVCGEVATPAQEAHKGGTAGCAHKAECSVCGKEYGDLLAHKPVADDGDCTTAVACSVCGGVAIEANEAHSGGLATCEQQAECSTCGTAYGELAAHSPHLDDGDCTTAVTCLVCSEVVIAAKDAHVGGEATCERKARCAECKMEYGGYAEHVPYMDDGDCTTDLYCSSCWKVITPANASHTGGKATCEHQAECTVCGTAYGEFAPHIPNKDDGTCLTEITCSVCGDVTTPAQTSHAGGKATCEHQAACAACGTAYGEFAPHIPNKDDGTCLTAITCSVCGDVTTPANASHTGGKATCEHQAACTVCGTAYGELAPHTPGRDDGDCTTAVMCLRCDKVATPAKEAHVGGTASCKKKAECEVCGKKYGEYAPHIPGEDDGDCTTPILCSVCDDMTTPGRYEHTGGKATCMSRAACEVCGKEYGGYSGHVPREDDGDCTTDILCSGCDDVLTPGNANHTGGTATCAQKARCSVCNTEYGALLPHQGHRIWIKHLNTHYQVYSCCYTKVSDSEGHNMAGGACSLCGFNPTVTITSVEVAPGDTQVKIAISIADNPEITGLMVKLEYNESVFILTGANSGAALEGLNFTAPGSLHSGCTFLWDGIEIDDEDIKEGEILILTFNVSATAPAGEYTLSMKITAYDNDLTPFTLIIEGGKVTVKNT